MLQISYEWNREFPILINKLMEFVYRDLFGMYHIIWVRSDTPINNQLFILLNTTILFIIPHL